MPELIRKKWTVPRVSKEKRIQLIDELIVALRRYRGAKIVAGRHPVHVAAVALEEATFVLSPESRQKTGKTRQLYGILKNCLWMMIWVSRGTASYSPGKWPLSSEGIGRLHSPSGAKLFRSKAKHVRKNAAKLWGNVLIDLLLIFRNIVESGELDRIVKAHEYRAKEVSGKVGDLIFRQYHKQ